MKLKIKNCLLILLMIFSFSICNTVYAETTTDSLANSSEVSSDPSSTSDLTTDDMVDDNSGTITCNDLLGSKDDEGSLMYLISLVYNILRIIAVIMVIVLGMLDFSGAVAASDGDKLNKAGKKFIRRLILLVVFFFIPTLLNLILGIVFGSGYMCQI